MKKPSKGRTKDAKVKVNKGGRPVGSIQEQEEWLMERLPLFIEARQKGQKKLADFWPSIWEGWFEKWPMLEPSIPSVPMAEAADPVRHLELKLANEKARVDTLQLKKTVSK